jgi:hypothetical protein
MTEQVLTPFLRSVFPFEFNHHIYFKKGSPSFEVFGQRVFGKFRRKGLGESLLTIELLKISYFNNFLSDEAMYKLEETPVMPEDIDLEATYSGLTEAGYGAADNS